jgi:hypothetical protein
MTPEQRQQGFQVAALLELVKIPVGTTFSNPIPRSVLPSATHDRLVIQAALGYLLANGIIEVKPQAEWPFTLPMRLPEHLAPDVKAAVDKAIAARGPMAAS